MSELIELRQLLIDNFNLYKSKCLALDIDVVPLIYENYYYKVESNKIHCLGFVDESLIPNDLVIDEVFDVFDIEFYNVSKKEFNSIKINHNLSFGFDFQFYNLNINYFELNKVESITLPLFFKCNIGEVNAPVLKYLCSHCFEESSVDILNIPDLKLVSMATFENTSLSYLDLSNVGLLPINLCANNDKLERVVIKKNAILSDRLFKGCKELKIIENIESVDNIPNQCFSNSGVEELNLKSVINIGEKSFSNSKIRKLILSNRLKTIGVNAFNHVKNLEIDFYGSEEEYNRIELCYGNDGFLNAKVNYVYV